MGNTIFGQRVERVEDPRFLRGAARYTDNIPSEGALRAVFVRSSLAHARILGVDTSAALAMPGVRAVYTSADISVPAIQVSGSVPNAERYGLPALAIDVVRWVGQPIAVVVAETLAQAIDAAEEVIPDLEPLDVVADPVIAASAGSAVLYPETASNEVETIEERWDEDILAGAEVVVRGTFVNQRLAPVPMETNAMLAEPDGEGGLVIHASTQCPFDVRNDVADALDLPRERVRVVAPDVGGSFGTKMATYPEYLALAAIARAEGRAVRWNETRSESMTSLAHGRAQIHTIELGAKRDGTLVGLRADILADMGAHPLATYLVPTTRRMLSGTYRIPHIAVRGRCVVTNTTPVAAYRGAGRPEATALVERAMDLLAAELDRDPVELRRQNLIPSDAFPYETVLGDTYDSGDYAGALDLAAETIGYDALRAEQRARRERGDRTALGIGVCSYVEITGFSPEQATVEVDEDGWATVLAGTSPHGQGHETAFTQLVSGLLGIPSDRVRIVHSDTGRVPSGQGTFGSRSLQIGGSVIWQQAEAVLRKAKAIAAHLLEVHADELEAEDGGIGVPGDHDRWVGWDRLAKLAQDPTNLPDGVAPGLIERGRFRQSDSTFPFGAHIAVCEVDLDTGDARLVRHVAVDDCGRVLNPMLVEGQVHGGLAQGIAQALYEEVRFDEWGTPLTGNLSSYPMPAATEFPRWETVRTETPSPLNPLGAKGIGESAAIGSTPAVQNAVIDALAHLGVRHVDMPLTPERVLGAIVGASSP